MYIYIYIYIYVRTNYPPYIYAEVVCRVTFGYVTTLQRLRNINVLRNTNVDQ